VFAYQTRIHFHEADPAGIAFFANSYVLAHNAFEDFVQHLGFTWKDWFENESWGVPIRQSSCEHLRPMLVGEAVQIKITLERIGDSSFTLLYIFEIAAATTCEVRLVHTFMDRKTRGKLSIPTDIRRRLEAYQR
jgi:YbgC/YbaW family acyl-CoA thioester hydrolase